MYFDMRFFFKKKITFHAFVNAFFKKNKQKKFMHCRAFNIYLSTRKIKLHANQQKILLEKGLSVVSPYFTTRMYNLSDIIQRSI